MFNLIYFSPTGNTKHLMNTVVEQLQIEKTNIHQLEFTKYDDLSKLDHLILMYPIHGFNPPRTVVRFIKNLPTGLSDKVSLIAVGCNDLWINDAVSLRLRTLLTKKNYQVIVDEIVSMPLTLVMDFPEEIKVKTIQSAERRIFEITESIKQSEVSTRKVKFKSKVIHVVGKLEDPAARLFGLELHAKKNCTSCGICWNNCPELNIKPNKYNKPKFGLSCEMCMRCIYSCPEKAITPYISKFLVIKDGYKI